MSVSLPECPASLKAIAHYLKTAVEHDVRDQVVSYYCRLYALQTGLKLSTHQANETQLLLAIMDWLEATKKSSANELITQEVAGQAHLENYALKLFSYADKQDREGNFGKNVVKAFYTAGIIYDVLETFGDLTEEVLHNRKYAKWKAAYIHRCLKNGEQPIAGPMPDEGGDVDGDGDEENATGGASAGPAARPQPSNPPPPAFSPDPIEPRPSPSVPASVIDIQNLPEPPIEAKKPPGGFRPFNAAGTPRDVYVAADTASEGGGGLTSEQTAKAQNYCKWASNSLTYGDLTSAVENLTKALRLVQTKQDS